jgi:hypothetical protein
MDDRIVRDEQGNIVTDPAILEHIFGKPVKVPTTVDVTPKVNVAAADETATEAATGGGLFRFARNVLSGEAVAQAPSFIASKVGDTLDGADKMRAQEDARRHRGMTPEYRDLGTSPAFQKPIQFASNVAADAIGTVASKVALPVEVGIQGARSAAEIGAGALTDLAVKARQFGLDSPSNWLFGELSAKALEKEQLRGKYRTMDALERRAEGVQEFLKGAAFGMSPAVYAAAEASARGEDVADAAWETFLAYPLASIIPFAHLGRTATAGNQHAVSGGEKLHTARGEPVMVNPLGQKIIDKSGPMVQRLAFDAVPTERVKQIRTTGEANQSVETPSPAAKNLAGAVTQYNVLRDLEAELADPKFAGATEWQKFQAIEGTLGGKGPQQAPVLDAGARGKAQALGESLVLDGMDPVVAQQAVPYVLFEGVRAAKAGMMADPILALDQFSGQLAAMQPAQRGQFVKSFEQVVKQRLNDPTFLAAADQAWSSPKGDLQWIPRSEVRQRAGYVEAFNKIKLAEKDAGRQVFDLHIPELGELKKDYTYNLYSNLVDDLRSSPEGRDRVLNLLRSNPVARVGANPHAGIPEQALATWANQPGGARRRFVDAINKASLEISENLGVDPLVIAKNFDRYLSRSFRDALDGNDKLLEMLNAMDGNPAQAAVRGFDKQGGRFKRKLGDKGAGTDFMDRVAKGEIDLTSAMATTTASMIALSQNLHAMSQIEGVLRKNGALFDPDPVTGASPKPGLVFTGTTKAAPAGQRASSDPYNFLLGKMANKWVDPAIASALNLQIEALPRAHAALQVWRWIKTVANVPKYQFTQLVNDNMMMWGLTGESRFSPKGRPIALKAQAAIDRFVASTQQPHPQQQHVLSPEMKALQQYGMADYSGVPMELESLPPSVRGWVAKQAMTLSNQVIRAADPADAMGVLAQSVMHLKTGVKLPAAVRDGLMAFGRGLYDADVSAAKNPASRGWTRASSGFAAAHDVLTKNVLSLATSMAEQQRRLQAFMFGKELLGLSDEQAAVLASESVYGIEPTPMGIRKVVTHPVGQLLAPPFLNFGVWQLKKTTQRALNDKALWLGHAIEQGVRAYEEEMQDDRGNDFWETRLTDSMLRHSTAPDVGLTSTADLAEAMQTMGLPANLTDMVRGEKDRNPYITMTLRDLGGYQSAFSNINLDMRGDGAGIRMLLSLNPTAQTAAQLLDPTMANPFQFGSGVPLGSMDPAAFTAGLLEIGASLFSPTTVSKHGNFVKDMGKIATGVQPTKFGGSPRNPVEVATSLWGPFAMNVVDKLDTMERVDRRSRYYLGQMKAQARRDVKQMEKADIPDEVKFALLDKTQANAWALQKQLELGMGWAFAGYSRQDYQKAAKEIDQMRKDAVAAAEKGAPNGVILSKWAQMGTLSEIVSVGQKLFGLALTDDEPEPGAE